MHVVPMASEHIDAMAELLVSIHSTGGEESPVSTLADRAVALDVVGSAIGSWPGVVAVADSSVVGFLVAPLPSVPGPTGVRLRPHHHAARTAEARSSYRHMYEAVARTLVTSGCTYHSMPVMAASKATLKAMFELGFGVDQIKGFLPLSDRSSAGERLGVVRPADKRDVDRILELAIELQKFHARSPMFQPALLNVPAMRRGVTRAIDDDRCAVLVVADGNRVVAMLEADPDGGYLDTVSIGMNVVTETARAKGVGTAMLSSVLEWATTRGYRYCTVGWSASNLVSDSFYRSRGFTPHRYRLHRTVDARVAWANERLDYSAFRLDES